MKKLKFQLLALFCLFFSMKGYSQTTGDQPSNTKWKFIENENVKVIFTDSSEVEAKRIADIIDYIKKNKTTSIGEKSRKIDLLLNTNTTQSNGYVRLAPYMSEFYGTSFQNFNTLGSINWLDGLAVHEYRHALQFNNARRGLTKFSSFYLGEMGWAATMGLSIPNWYMEGDAVLAETLLSSEGRGRLPSFFEEQRVLLLNNKDYSYIKARNGSFKDLMPNHYQLGYALLNYGRNHYNDTMWSKVLADAGAYKSFFYPFSKALKKQTGLSTKKMYHLAYQELKQQWEEEINRLELTPIVAVTKNPSKTVTNYTYPHYLNDGNILCIKNSYNETPTLVQIIDGNEKQLTTIGISSENFLSVNGSKVAWTEIKKDPRRNAVNYNAIIEYDLTTGIKKTITVKSKLFSPQFSSNSEKIVAVNANENLKNSLKILDAKNGLVIQTIPNPENDFLSYPKWTSDDNSIIFVAKHNSKVALLKYDLVTNKKTNLTPWSSNIIGNYTLYKNKIYFSASFSGINNIYSVDSNGNQEITQITSVKIGADMPTVSNNGETVCFSELTFMGHQIEKLDLSKAILKTIAIVEPVNMLRFNVKTTEIERNSTDSIPTNNYIKKDYKGFFKGTKLHSWSPSISQTNLGLDLWFDTILNDFSAIIGGNYNLNENKFGFAGTIDYAKYFIPIQLIANSTDRSINSHFGTKITFKETKIGLGLKLPLSWYSGNYVRGINWSSSFTNTSTSNFKFLGISIANNQNFNDLESVLSLYNSRNKALQNTTNKWSQRFKLLYNKSLTNGIRAERISGNLSLFLAGIGKNDGLEFNFKAKKELLSNDYFYTDSFEHSRGYSIMPNDLETVFTTNYSFPLFYLHAGGNVAYCNRVVTNLFCDLGNVKKNANKTNYQQNSIGVDFIFDLKWLNVAPLNFGIRNTFLLNPDYLLPNKKYELGLFVSQSF